MAEQEVDEDIMFELLQQPNVRKETASMTAETLAWYKELLVSQGIYAQYVQEREAQRGRRL